MSLLTAIRLPRTKENTPDLLSVEELQAHYDLPAYEPARRPELRVAFRDVGYARVGANAVRKYLPKILAGRGVQLAEAQTRASLLAERIHDSGATFQGLNQAMGQVAGSAEVQDSYKWETHALQGQDVAYTLEAIDAMVVCEAPALEHAGTYAGAIALHMLETMPHDGNKITLGR